MARYLARRLVFNLSASGCAAACFALALAGASSAQQVTWQQRSSAAPKQIAELGAGANVNPSTASQVRMRLSSVPAGCTVSAARLLEVDWSSADDSTPGPTLLPPSGGEILSSWITPPLQTDDPGSHSEWLIEVVLDCPGGQKTVRSGCINVPDGVVNEDIERTSSESTVAAGGAVRVNTNSAEANVQYNVSTTTQRRRVVDFAATYRDPLIRVSLVVHPDAPADWAGCLTLDPAEFTIGPGIGGSVNLVASPACSPGIGLVSIRSVSLPTGLEDETDPLRVEIAAASPAVPTLSERGIVLFGMAIAFSALAYLLRRPRSPLRLE